MQVRQSLQGTELRFLTSGVIYKPEVSEIESVLKIDER